MGIGPSTKETSLHHFRDPLVDIVGSDEGIDLMGVLLFGTADDNVDKIRNSTRAAIVAECMRADGVIISSDGWGNSDVDYVNRLELQRKHGYFRSRRPESEEYRRYLQEPGGHRVGYRR